MVELDAPDRVDEVDGAGRSVTSAGKSSTSKTRSKLTSAVSTSTRAFVSWVSGW